MAIAIVGDIHSNLESLHTFIANNRKVAAIIQVGDLGLFFSKELAKRDKDWVRFPQHVAHTLENKRPFQIPVYFIKGNHEEFESLEAKALRSLNVFYVPQGTVFSLEDKTFGCLGGIYSPKYWDKDPNILVGLEKRFYTNADVSLLLQKKFDYLITHEGPVGVIPGALHHGSLKIKELIQQTQPKITFHGHHHVQYLALTSDLGEIHGLGNFSTFNKSYKILP